MCKDRRFPSSTVDHQCIIVPCCRLKLVLLDRALGTARDWARFGLLHLEDGVWQGQRILPEGWVKFVRTPASAELNKNYGGLWWLNRGKDIPAKDRSPEGIPPFDNLPSDLFYASGAMGQRVMVIPSQEAVIVRQGFSLNEGNFGKEFEKVVANILKALKRKRA